MSGVAKGIGSALANIVTFGGYGANKAAKQQASASQAMLDAIKNQPKQKEITTETKDVSSSEASVDSAARRRRTIASTANNNTLTGLRKTLG